MTKYFITEINITELQKKTSLAWLDETPDYILSV